MIRLLWRTDVHCRENTPSSRKDDWVETVMSKLAEVGELAHQYSVDAVLDGGDFFDDKLPIRTPHKLVSRVAALHSKYPCPVYANVGNHDVQLSQLDNLSRNPLETLFSSGVFKRLYNEHELLLEKEGVSVRVVGVPYHGPRYDLDRFRSIKKKNEDWLVCVAHVLASPHGGEMFKNEDIIKYRDLIELSPDVDVFAFGHWHKNQGITEIGKNKWVVNVGSLTRGSLNQDNIDREPGVVIMGFWPREKGLPPSLDFIKIKIEASSVVFDLDKREKEELRESTMDAFVDAVKKELQSSQGAPFSEILVKLEVPEEIKERALQYLSLAEKA